MLSINIKKPASKISLRKWPPSKILVKPTNPPKNKESQRKILFLVIKNKTIIENPTEASPETKEQLLSQKLEILNHGVKISFPPNSNISFGRALPQEFFRKRLTKTKRLKRKDSNIKKISGQTKLWFK